MQEQGSWEAFVATTERVGGTRARLEKAAHLAAYFATLGDADLALAARFMAGLAFASWDSRVLGVGSSAMLGAIAAASGVTVEQLRAELVARGDLGDVAAAVLPEHDSDHGMQLADVAELLAALAAARGAAARVALLSTALQRLPAAQGRCLIKLVGGELRIGLKEGAVEDALARLAGVPVASIGWANMLLGDVGETAVLARQQQLDRATMRLFHPLRFMLATPAADAADVAACFPQGCIVEDKYDGIRAQAHVSRDAGGDAPRHGVACGGAHVALFSRTLDDITASFPDLLAPLAELVAPGGPSAVLLDGEIVPVNGAAVLPFATLQTRLGRKKPTAAVVQAVPVALWAFDVLYADGDVLLTQPHTARRARLEALLGGAAADAVVRLTPSEKVAHVNELDDRFAAARARRNEGLMLKNPGAAYRPGRRGRDWLKLKKPVATLDVVVTAAEVGHGRRHKWLSDYTFAVRQSADDPTLLNVGKAYSGLTDSEIEALTVFFQQHTLQTFAHGKVRVVQPKVVLEVAFDRVQASARHKSGYSLRFARIVRIRHDKTPDDIDTLQTVARLAES